MTPRDKAPKRQGRPGRIDEDTAGWIVDVVGLPLRDGVDDEALAAALNHVATETAIRAHKLPPQAKMKALSMFRDSFEAMLKQIERTLPKHGLRPPSPDAEWVEEIKGWLLSCENKFSVDPSMRGGRPPALPPHFFDLILGLYNAAFGEEPAYTYQEVGKKFGPTGRFVESCISALIESDDELEVYIPFLVSRGSKDDWRLLGGDALRKALMQACKRERTTDTWEIGASTQDRVYEWQVYSKFFRDNFLQAKSGEPGRK